MSPNEQANVLLRAYEGGAFFERAKASPEALRIVERLLGERVKQGTWWVLYRLSASASYRLTDAEEVWDDRRERELELRRARDARKAGRPTSPANPFPKRRTSRRVGP